MRIISASVIGDTVKELVLKANIRLRKDILSGLKGAMKRETNKKAQRFLDALIQNAYIAMKKRLPICQDTGMVVVYLKIGQGLYIKGDFKKEITRAVEEAYRIGYFRKSVVKDPIIRENTGDNLPPIIYLDTIRGSRLEIIVIIKGFGCENVSKIKMFRPTDTIKMIEDFIVEAVEEAGSKSCPPVYIGVGIGGTLDKAVFLSREAILESLDSSGKEPHILKMEKELLQRINKLGIGAGGVGGKITALGVRILTYPTHIAGLPVAVNISCHATRTARKII